MSDIELRHFTSFNSSQMNHPNSPSVFSGSTSYPDSWNEVGGLNPTYHMIDDASTKSRRQHNDNGPVDPTSNERMYDSVPGNPQEKVNSPPPLPDTRRVTPNALYASRGDTLHPQTMEKPTFTNEVEPEIEYNDGNSSSCLRVCLLSFLVVVSLFLAIVAVILVMILWFGVYTPEANCPNEMTASTDPVIGTTNPTTDPTTDPITDPTMIPTTDPTTDPTMIPNVENCTCSEPDLQPIIDRIEEEAYNLTKQIDQLKNDLELFSNQSDATNANIVSQADSLNDDISSVNSSCYSTLDSVSQQIGSFEGLNFNAQLLNIGVFNSCVYEYLHECKMDLNTFNCSTDYFPVIVANYSNLEIACHVAVENVNQGAAPYAPLTHLRFEPNNFPSNTDPLVILSNSMMRCECTLIALSNEMTRNNIFYCKMFRTRCLSVSTYDTTIIT